MMANDPKALNEAFDKIEAKITDLLCNNVMVTDVLSENVKMVTNSETETTPKKLVVTIKKNEDGSIVQGPATSVKDGDYEIKAEYNATAKQITLKFDSAYTLNPDYTYIVTATIEATEKAYENVRANEGVYPNIGDAGTGDTSAGQRGVYSNEDGKAKVSYVYNDSKETEYYNKPVIQLEPAHLTINKTITGLTEEKINSALNDKLTFNITYTYPTGEQKTVTETKKLSDFTKTADGTYTYTSGDIWSMGATYKVTETGYDTVTDYDCTAKPTNASGSIPKYSTATASFTNAYTLSTQDLTITKAVEGGDSAHALDVSNITYTFEVSAAEGVNANGDYAIANSNVGKVTFTNGQASVQIPGTSSITIKGLPVGKYTVTETKRSAEPTGYEFDKSTATTGEAVLTSNSAGQVTITNKYKIKTFDVTVVKEVTGNMGDTNKKFSFTHNETPFELKDKGTRVFTGVKYGTKFTVSEDNYSNDGYTTSYTVNNGEKTDGRTCTTTVTSDTTITFTNDKTIQPPNGITTTIAPYAIMVVLAAGAAVYFVYSRRRHNG